MRVFHARVEDADACVFDTQARYMRVFWAQYLQPVLYECVGLKLVSLHILSLLISHSACI